MSNKPRMVRVSDPVECKTLEDTYGDLNVPALLRTCGQIYCDADELRAWRESQNTSTGEGEK